MKSRWWWRWSKSPSKSTLYWTTKGLKKGFKGEKRWYHRYKVQGFVPASSETLGWAYQPKYFITLCQASKFQAGIYKDHGPGMVRVVLNSIHGSLRTEMS